MCIHKLPTRFILVVNVFFAIYIVLPLWLILIYLSSLPGDMMKSFIGEEGEDAAAGSSTQVMPQEDVD